VAVGAGAGMVYNWQNAGGVILQLPGTKGRETSSRTSRWGGQIVKVVVLFTGINSARDEIHAAQRGCRCTVPSERFAV